MPARLARTVAYHEIHVLLEELEVAVMASMQGDGSKGIRWAVSCFSDLTSKQKSRLRFRKCKAQSWRFLAKVTQVGCAARSIPICYHFVRVKEVARQGLVEQMWNHDQIASKDEDDC